MAASRSQSEVDEPRDVTDGTVTAGLAALAMPAFWAVWADDGASLSRYVEMCHTTRNNR